MNAGFFCFEVKILNNPSGLLAGCRCSGSLPKEVMAKLKHKMRSDLGEEEYKCVRK